MDEESARFINRNSGVTICCSGVEIDEKARTVVLTNASLINGAQTQGEIRGFLRDLEIARAQAKEQGTDDIDEPDFHIRAEINVDPDDGSVIETAIARNSATSVKSISQAGARGILKDLEEAFRSELGLQITTSETDDDPDAVDTKLIARVRAFGWNGDRRAANLAAHRIDFEDVRGIFGEPAFVSQKDRHGEIRYRIFGTIHECEVAVACAFRGDVCWLLSARRARSDERGKYHRLARQRRAGKD